MQDAPAQRLPHRRHAHDGGDLAGLEDVADGVGSQLLQVGDARPARQRDQQPGRELEGVVQGQHGQHAVGGPQVEGAQQLGHHESEIPMSQHHPLRVSGGARGEDE